MPDWSDELLTVYDVADRLKANQQTVRNWIDRGELVGVRLGSRRVRVRESDLGQFVSAASSARRPDEASAREALSRRLEEVSSAADRGAEAAALRALAKPRSTVADVS
jgi:excisionase family DNA binding protein